jgi:hypothetical protein
VNPKTISEETFEEFCEMNGLQCLKIPECDSRTPDYKVTINSKDVIFEIKQIDSDDGFLENTHSRTVGKRVREKIDDARKQFKGSSKNHLPAILLVYNNLDSLQKFGTEEHDFITAMYGEMTVSLHPKTHAITDSYHGRNQSLRHDKNTSFSGVGHLYTTVESPAVLVYENVYSKNKLDFESLPSCIDVKRIKIVNE